jgi:peptidoglycan hydrolase FlgJ
MSTPFNASPLAVQLTMPQAAARPATPPPEPTEAMKKAAEEFESMMLSELLGPMFNALDTDGIGGGGSGEKMFRPMLVDNYAKGVVARGGIGIAQAVLAELVRMQTISPEAISNAAAR